MLKYLLGWLCILLPFGVLAQQATLSGRVLNQQQEPLESAMVALKGTSTGTRTNAAGAFKLIVPAGTEWTLVVRHLGYKALEQKFILQPGESRDLSFILEPDPQQLQTVDVQGKAEESREQVSVITLDPRDVEHLPSTFGDFNKVLVTLPGVSSNNELSSTYSVRGGNYDENLVYVNNIEIYRPFLISSAQQEGLSFVNPDLVGNIEFSSGGWQPKYGDKLSSVLNIKYKQPSEFGATVSGGLTGGALHLESASKNKKVSYLFGARHKNGQYILKGLQTEGKYNPIFTDAQAYVHFDLTKDTLNRGRTTLGILTSYANNDFRVEPETQATTFGTRNTPLRLLIAFDGQERMEYATYQAGLNLTHRFTAFYTSELILSGVHSREREFRDVEAGYRLCDVDTNGDGIGDCLQERGVGSSFNHARNTLLARILAAELRNTWQASPRSNVQFGLKVGSERIEDQLQEYGFTDSADYVTQDYYLRSQLDLNTLRYSGYLQHTIALDSLRTFTYGMRATYWDFTGELNISPRVQYSFITRRNPNLSFKTALGLYYQPPFYRELRDFNGVINPDLKAQRSVHAIVGSDYLFQAWGRDFKLATEAYYKWMTNVIPYDLDNVRLRYYARNNAKAYAAGFDVRVNGEFIPGAESWLSLGLLTTKENVEGDSISVHNAQGEKIGMREQGFLRRPTDQLVNFSLFFQDHLPDNPTVRMYLNLVYGSGLPFGPPRQPEYRSAFDGRSYKRIDIGFSKVLVVEGDVVKRKKLGLESLWIGLEVLNLIDAKNWMSYNYVSDVNDITYAVPNYLTGRRLNVRFVAKF